MTTQLETSRPAILRVGGALLAAVLLGGATSWAQGWLPDALTSFANSASGWLLLTVVLVAWARVGELASAVLAAAVFVLLVLGYTGASELRGLTYDPTLFGVVGVVVGPFVGVATAWLRRVGWRPYAAAAFLAGIAIGEAVYGLTVVAASTSPVYWLLAGACGVALLVTTIATRPAGTVLRIAAVAAAGAEAAVFVLAYSALGGI